MKTDLKIEVFALADLPGRVQLRISGNTIRGGRYMKVLEMREGLPIDIDDFADFLHDCDYEARNAIPFPTALAEGMAARAGRTIIPGEGIPIPDLGQIPKYPGVPFPDETQLQPPGENVYNNVVKHHGPWDLITSDDRKPFAADPIGRPPGRPVNMADTPFGKSIHYNPDVNYDTDFAARAFADGWNAHAERYKKPAPDFPQDPSLFRESERKQEEYKEKPPTGTQGNWSPSIHKDPGEGE